MTRPQNRGFTLIEVLISLVVLGIVSVVISSLFLVIVRTQPTAEARINDARSLLGVTTWFPGDVNSTPRQPIASASPNWWNVDSTAASGCTGGSIGTNLIRLRWRETANGTTDYEASYRIVDDGGWEIKRVSCVVGGAAEVIRLTADLPDPSVAPVVVTLRTDTTTNEVIGATMVITTIAGDTVRVDAVSDNLNQTLPTLPSAVTTTAAPTTTSTSTTTSTTTTTLPSGSTTTSSSTSSTTSTTSTTTTAVPCTASFVSVLPNPVANQPKDNGTNDTLSPLVEPVNVTITKAGDCSGLALQYIRSTTGAPADRQPVSTLFGASTTITLQSLATERWQDGNRTLSLFDTTRATTLATTVLVIV